MSKINKETLAYANKKKYIQRWNSQNIKQYCLSLNKDKDKDIIDLLAKEDNATGFIKDVLRSWIASHRA